MARSGNDPEGKARSAAAIPPSPPSCLRGAAGPAVLGDAELILRLAAFGEAKSGHARITNQHMGSIDSQPVRELVEDILEGGKDALEMRRSKYGF